MKQRLRGQVALVTGGAGGIGRAIADQLTGAGVTVATADLAGRGADHALDVCEPASVEEVVQAVLARHGHLEIVVASAGVGVAGPIETLDIAAWRRAIDVNLWGVIHTVRAVYPHLVEQQRGTVVLLASLSGLVPTPLLVPYATTKHAVVGLGTSLAPEARRHGIGVTVVCPGPVETAMLDTGGVGGEVQGGVDVRRFLTGAVGAALPPDAIAKATVRGIERGRVVVTPGRARLLWRVGRFSPRLVQIANAKAMRDELAHAR